MQATGHEQRRLCVIVCQNGLGHFRRATQVVASLLQRHAGRVRVDLVADAWQMEMTARSAETARLLADERVAFHAGRLDGSPRWASGGEDAAAYFAWTDRIGSDPLVRDADLVVSDNLVGVLAARPDAVLMGSFLWHEVIRGRNREADRIAYWDERMLEATRPPMLCVGEVAMPEVLRLTRAEPLPWFCEPSVPPRPHRWPVRTVLLLGGATGAAAPAMAEAAAVLHRETEVALVAPERVLPAAIRNSPRVSVFGFRDADFAACDVAIGRAGVGMLTDCVRTGLPLICFGDEDNTEIRHNARRVEALGIGRRIGLADGAAAAARLLQGELARSEYIGWCRNLAARPTGGISAAASFISRRLQLEDEPERCIDLDPR